LGSIEVIEDGGIRDISAIINELIFVIVWLFKGLSLPCFFLGWCHLVCRLLRYLVFAQVLFNLFLLIVINHDVVIQKRLPLTYASLCISHLFLELATILAQLIVLVLRVLGLALMLLLGLAVGTSADVKVVLVVIAHLLIVKLQGLLLPLGFLFPASTRRRIFIGIVGSRATRLVNSL